MDFRPDEGCDHHQDLEGGRRGKVEQLHVEAEVLLLPDAKQVQEIVTQSRISNSSYQALQGLMDKTAAKLQFLSTTFKTFVCAEKCSQAPLFDSYGFEYES